MKRSTSIASLTLFLLIGACAQDDAAEDVATDQVVLDAASDTMNQPAAAGMGQTAQFQPVNDSGIAGEATVTDRGAESEVMVRLTGASPNGTHPGHIHSGTCAAIGSVVQPLQEIATDATGTGTMTTTVAIAPMTLSNGQHIIVYHGEGGAPATCAQIQGHTM
jgi:hypothetical protein